MTRLQPRSCGGMTVCVVSNTPCKTGTLRNVIPKSSVLVVAVGGNAVSQQIIAHAKAVLTTEMWNLKEVRESVILISRP